MFCINKSFLAFLANIIFILLFVSNKHSQIFFDDIFQIRIIYIFSLILFLIFIYDKYIVKTFEHAVNYKLFSLLTIYLFLISYFNQNFNLSFIKQFVGVVILSFGAYYLVYKFSLKIIFKKYLKFSIFFVFFGLIIYILNFFVITYLYLNQLEIYEIQKIFNLYQNTENQIAKFFLFFFFNDELYRLKSLSGESNSFGVILLPALNYFLYNFDKHKYKTFFYLTFLACILTFSLFVYLGIFLIFLLYFFFKKNNKKKLLFFFLFLIIFLLFNNFSLFTKFFDTYFFIPKIKNYSVYKNEKDSFLVDIKILNLPLNRELTKINKNEILNYKFSLLDKFLINNYLRLFSKKYLQSNKHAYQKAYGMPHNALLLMHPNGYEINSSTFAVLVNYYVFINSTIVEKIFGTGLGSFEKIKKKRIESFYIPGVISEKNYINLGNKDGKFLINRIVVELGFLFILLLLFIFCYALFNINKKNKTLIFSLLIFLIIKLLHHGHYMQFEIFLFLILIIRSVKNDIYSS